MLWIGCAVALLVVWTVIAIAGAERARSERRERVATVVSTAKGFSEYVGLHLLFLDRVLVNTRQAMARSGAIPSHDRLIAEMGSIGPILLQLAAADETGRVFASSLPLSAGVNVADRPHFLAFARDPRDRLHVSDPVVGRVSGKMSLQLVRPLHGPAGEFRGIIVASIDPLKFQQYFDSLDAFADGGTILIAGRNDGLVRARFSASGISWGQSLLGSSYWANLAADTSGSYEAASTIDGSLRLVGFQAVKDFPLVVSATAKSRSLATVDIAFGIALGLGFTLVVVSYVRTRVRRLRDQELVIEQLRQSSARAAEANRLKSAFVASISHELRTPLHAILGFSELLRDVPDHPDNPRRAGLVHSSGQHLLSLLNTLLDLAKIEAGRMEVDRSEVDLLSVTRTVLEVHRASADRKGLFLELHSRVPGESTVLAHTDGTKYMQVLNNVLNNAIKFTGSGGVRLDMSVAGDTFVLRVRDTGCGIRPELMPYVFDRFSTANAPGSLREEGTGLGLSLSRELIQLLGGSIEILSVPGSGTDVTIRLPDSRVREVHR